MGVFITKEYNILVNGEVLNGTTECLMLYTRCHKSRYLYNRVLLYY